MRILLDAMGGDNSPVEAIKGAVKAAEEIDSEIILIGNEEKICKIIKELYNKENIAEISPKLKIHHASQEIEMEDIPTEAI